MGLHAQEELAAGQIAGPHHPAFRELCEGRLMEERLLSLLSGKPQGGERLEPLYLQTAKPQIHTPFNLTASPDINRSCSTFI